MQHLRTTAEHGRAWQSKIKLRTLVGEHHGLAVTLTHGGLQLGRVRACLIMHPDSGGRRGVRAGTRGGRRRGCGGQARTAGQGRAPRGHRLFKFLNTTNSTADARYSV